MVEEAEKCQMVAHQLSSTQGKVIIYNSAHSGTGGREMSDGRPSIILYTGQGNYL